ncbi:survival motor neuron protein [Battus philenor]|uniref:survival motor neuron protein n=1 Tax=Battus philenor TaxID=42288 RepID=UPI0035D0F78C
MSKCTDLLYVKGMNLSESEDDNAEEDVWDDRKLNDAYDKALKIANAEVAKRLAMSTNTQHMIKLSLEKDQSKTKKETQDQPVKNEKKTVQWKAGMPCRAIYEGDGQEYEAFVLRLINDKECIVRFLGYENSEIVAISSLKQTLGKNERTRQIQQALCDKEDDGFASQSALNNMECSDVGTSTGSTGSFQKKKKHQKKKRNQPMMNNLLDMPIPMLNPSMLGNLSSMDMPLPPPPPLGFSSEHADSEDQAISSMLLSWYMSGYYTGLYQGMKRAKDNKRNAIH